MSAYVVQRGAGEVRELGAVRFAILAGSGSTHGGFAVLEFQGAEGDWTVPHVHEQMEESFYILEGTFTFIIGGEQTTAVPGSFVLVPRGVPHVLHAGEGGGRLLAFTVPGGLEQMFIELSELGPGSLTDPTVRARISSKYDSKPVG